MHFAILLFMLFAAWRWGDWKNINRYHSTMLFSSFGSLLYLFLYKNMMLWDLQKHILNHTLTELLYAFILLPATTLLLLSNFPENMGKRAYRIGKFIAIYSIMEFIIYKLGFITYTHGWNFILSVGWYLMMFPLLMLHFKKPLYAYLASLIGLIIFIYIFPIN